MTKQEAITFARAIEQAATAPLLARIAELEAELEKTKAIFAASCTHAAVMEMERDARRYRWIVSVCESDGFGYWLPEVCLKEGNLPPSKSESDAAIDAAMKDE